ncbi:SpdD protein [Streptomyces sp. NPDC005012]|uniref:SpdD protein n=1 Tax=Streptomyces sp. NPDC005012 TaxID=3154558 RepID=UPI0033A17875
MLTPKIPPPDTAQTTPVPASSTASVPMPVDGGRIVHHPVTPTSNRPVVQLTPGSAVALAAGGGAVVLVVGAVLVSMLLAVAITGISVAVTAIILRLLVNDMRKDR